MVPTKFVDKFAKKIDRSTDKFDLEEPVRVASTTRINLEEPVRVASTTRINQEEPVRVASPTRINSPGGTRQDGQPNQD